ncbi:hypothetical protein BDR07DRAFT_1374366 [Suillus spraguei]|nr:hypothetical protein BDR07DRAFT_1374366 [Suillus spraguei]
MSISRVPGNSYRTLRMKGDQDVDNGSSWEMSSNKDPAFSRRMGYIHRRKRIEGPSVRQHVVVQASGQYGASKPFLRRNQIKGTDEAFRYTIVSTSFDATNGQYGASNEMSIGSTLPLVVPDSMGVKAPQKRLSSKCRIHVHMDIFKLSTVTLLPYYQAFKLIANGLLVAFNHVLTGSAVNLDP